MGNDFRPVKRRKFGRSVALAQTSYYSGFKELVLLRFFKMVGSRKDNGPRSWPIRDLNWRAYSSVG